MTKFVLQLNKMHLTSISDFSVFARRLVSTLAPYLIVFSASACGLIIEIVASRLLAPIIGVSLFTWTSIIGVALAGISIGNYVGGLTADKFPSHKTLGLILIGAGLSSLAALPILDLVRGLYDSLHILARIVLLSSTLFLVPSIVLGMVTPVVIKLRLRDISKTGNVVGKIYAVSTAGSIFGVFVTGFFLIQWFGARPTLIGVAVFLILMSVLFGNLWHIRPVAFMVTSLLVFILTLGFTKNSFQSRCLVESNYYCINVYTYLTNDDRLVRTLQIDQLIHSFVDIKDPTFLVYSYEKVFADVATLIGNEKPQFSALHIGGGGYSTPRFLETTYPKSRQVVIEIDPAVTRVAHEYMSLPDDTGIISYNLDARQKVFKLEQNSYDIVLGDAFNDKSVPYHLTTLEFNQEVRRLLTKDGVYLVNVLDKFYSGEFLRAVVTTMQASFPYVYLFAYDNNDDRRSPYVVAGTLNPFDFSKIDSSSLVTQFTQDGLMLMTQSELSIWLDEKPSILLTDEYAPVDNLVVPLFLDD